MKKFEISDSIIHENIEEDSVIVAPHRATISALNETGNRIFEIIAEDKPVFTQIVDKIQNEYEVSREAAEADVRFFLDKLLENGLIREV